MYQNIYFSRKDNIIVLFDDEFGIKELEYIPYGYKRSDNGSETSIYGDKLEKTFDVNTFAGELFESDVHPLTRTLIDAYEDDDSISKNHVIFNFDIEVDTEGGYAPVNDTWQAITSIAFKDSVSNVRTVLILDTERNVLDTECTDDRGPVQIYSFFTEKQLLKFFLRRYTTIKPTILTGWNTDGYDIPYLYNRLKKVLGNNYARQLSPIGIAYIKKHYTEDAFDTVIAGVSSLDYLRLYKQFTYSELPNYRLGTVGSLEVGLDKIEFEGNLKMLFQTDINKFVQYNLRDIDIVDALDTKLKLIELVQGICHVCHVPYEFIHYSSKFLEGALLTYLRRQKLVAPNKQKRSHVEDADDNDDSVGFKGAFVKNPVRGKYRWIFSNDINSLYPSTIRSLNISPETKVGTILNWDDVATENVWETNKLVKPNSELIFKSSKGTSTISDKQLDEMLTKYDLAISSAGVLYSQTERGLLPSILDKWYADRKEFQRLKREAGDAGQTDLEMFYDKRQHIQKILLNSLYGVLGLPVFRFYDLDNALSVTATGQTIIKATANKSNETYSAILAKSGRVSDADEDHVIYVDTDSTYMSNNKLVTQLGIHENDEKCKQLTIKVANNIVDVVNDYYDTLMSTAFNVSNHCIQTSGETIGRTGIWIIKKRYCIHKVYDLEKNVDVDKFHIKGLDVVRSSFPKKFRELMLDSVTKTGIIADFLLDAPKAVVDKKILDFRHQLHEFPVDEVARNTSVKNITKFEKLVSTLVLGQFPKIFKNDKGRTIGFPAHIKSAINFNKLIQLLGLTKIVEQISNGEKIKYVYLKPNQYGIEVLAFRGYHDPQPIVDFISTYYDGLALYERELRTKIDDFYDAMKWQPASESDEIVARYFIEDANVQYHKPTKNKHVEQIVDNSSTVSKFFS